MWALEAGPSDEPRSPSYPQKHPAGIAGPRPKEQSTEHTHSPEAGLIVCPVHPCPGTMLVSKANPGVPRVHVLLKKLLWGDEGGDFK